MYPDQKTARALLDEAGQMNPGPWTRHSLVAARCARAIAERCGLNGEKAFVLGMLHDIGRRCGVTGIRHAIDGYRFMMELGYDEVARICLTHSFAVKDLAMGLGRMDFTPEEAQFVQTYLESCSYDEYDWLMQVCDSIAMAEGVVDMETRMSDVKRRYGGYPQEKWDRHMELGRYFEERAGMSLKEMTRDVTAEE
ncbi:MAG: HDOD domain-containing protein [Clostridia bacterium]|nr:HDOD domain-containing protein [Clostridia bacterium]